MDSMASQSIYITKTGGVILLVTGFIILYGSFHYLPWTRSSTVSMRELLSVSIQLATLGGDKVWSIRKGHTSGNLGETVKGETKEGAKELLTRGDLESHRIIHSGFQTAFPELKLVSEEHDTSGVQQTFTANQDFSALDLNGKDEHIPMKDITVWIDPLDATQEYTENLMHYVTTMVCVAVNGLPTIGVIYQPFNKAAVWGYVGHGVSPVLSRWMSDGQKSLPSSRKKKKATIIIVSRSHAGDVEKVVKASLGEDVEVIPAGGAGYKVLQVVNSTADAYVHTTRIKKWDICAGDAILRALGGQMTTLKGEAIDYGETEHPQNDNGLLATVRDHSKFLKIFGDEFSKKHGR